MAMTDQRPSDDDERFRLPDAFAPHRISNSRELLVQAVYEYPGKHQGWYSGHIDVTQPTVSREFTEHDEVFVRSDDSDDDTPGSRKHYRLADKARKALIENGVIDEDPVSDMANEAEEPSQRVERGNVTIEGEFDARSDPLQLFNDRPVKETPAADAKADAPDEPSDVAESDVYAFALDADQTFSLIRSADEVVAREVYDQLRE